MSAASPRLLWATDHAEPVTCVSSSNGGRLVAMGTATGAVRLFFPLDNEEDDDDDSEKWGSLLLCAQSEEAIVGFCWEEEGEELIAVVGDVCMRAWNLAPAADDDGLQLVAEGGGGYRPRRRVECPLVHSRDYCATTSVLVDSASGSVFVARSDGECALVLPSRNTSTTASIHRDVGPLPSMDSVFTAPVGLRGNQVIYASVTSKHAALSVWTLSSTTSSVQLLPPLPISKRRRQNSGFGKCVFVSEHAFVFLDGGGGRLCLVDWSTTPTQQQHILLPSEADIVCFDFCAPHWLAYVRSSSGECVVGTLSSSGAVFTPMCSSSPHCPKASFRFNLPYACTLVAPSPSNSCCLVVFNDDLGLHLAKCST